MRTVEIRTSEIKELLGLEGNLPTEEVMLRIIWDPPAANGSDFPSNCEDKTYDDYLTKKEVKEVIEKFKTRSENKWIDQQIEDFLKMELGLE